MSKASRLVARLVSSAYRRDARFQAVVRIGPPAVAPLILALSTASEDGRLWATRALAEMGGPSAVEGLCMALSDQESAVRNAAEAGLSKRGENDALVSGYVAALRSSSPAVQEAAADALGRIGDARAVEALCAALPYVFTAATALGEIGDARAVDSLCAALERGPEYTIKTVSEALGKIGDARAVDSLCAALERGPTRSPTVAWALGEIGDARAVESLCAVFEHLKGDVDIWGVGRPAAEALGRIGDARAVDALCVAITDWSPDRRAAAAMALGRIRSRRAVEPLWVVALSDDDSGVRRAAVEALKRCRGNGTLAEQLLALRHGPFSESRKAAKALRDSGNPRAIEPLWTALWRELRAVEPLEEFRSDLTAALRNCGVDASLVSQLAALPRGPYAGPQRISAVETIGRAAIEPLCVLLLSADWKVAEEATEALGTIGDARAIEPLRSVLETAGSERAGLAGHNAARALAKIGDAAVATLCSVLDASNLDAADSAAEALAEIGDPRAIRPLCFALGREPNVTYAKGIEAVLRKRVDKVATDDLRVIAALSPPPLYRRSFDICGNPEREKAGYDHKALIQLARQELVRRGIEA